MEEKTCLDGIEGCPWGSFEKGSPTLPLMSLPNVKVYRNPSENCTCRGYRQARGWVMG